LTVNSKQSSIGSWHFLASDSGQSAVSDLPKYLIREACPFRLENYPLGTPMA
jgi:hypothetical protein